MAQRPGKIHFLAVPRLFYQPPAQILGGLEVFKLRRQPSTIHVLVIKPRITDDENSSLPMLRRRNEVVTVRGNNGPGLPA